MAHFAYADYADYADYRILIVEDHQLFAEAIRSALVGIGMTLLGIANTGREGLRMAREKDPNLVLLDLGLPDGDGIDVGKDMIASFPRTKVLALTAAGDARTLSSALKAGFHGYVTKDAPLSKFISAVTAVMRGEIVVPSRLSSAPETNLSEEERSAALQARQLTVREREVLQLLIEGVSGSAMAKRLSVSTNTVRTHVQNILTKLQVHSRLEAAAFAVRYGLVDRRSLGQRSTAGRYEEGGDRSTGGGQRPTL